MVIRLLIGIGIGVCLGALMGYFGKCASGTCPLTANPFRGAIYGGVMGLFFASSFGGAACSPPKATPSDIQVSPSVLSNVAEESVESVLLHIDSVEDFERYVTKAKQPCLADFYSDSCGPCRMLAPTIEKLAEAYKGKAVICKVNLDAASQLAQLHGIRGIPAVLFFEKGKEVERLVGLRPQKDYERVLDRLIVSH